MSGVCVCVCENLEGSQGCETTARSRYLHSTLPYFLRHIVLKIYLLFIFGGVRS